MCALWGIRRERRERREEREAERKRREKERGVCFWVRAKEGGENYVWTVDTHTRKTAKGSKYSTVVVVDEYGLSNYSTLHDVATTELDKGTKISGFNKNYSLLMICCRDFSFAACVTYLQT